MCPISLGEVGLFLEKSPVGGNFAGYTYRGTAIKRFTITVSYLTSARWGFSWRKAPLRVISPDTPIVKPL
jgi:hypothetical protein